MIAATAPVQRPPDARLLAIDPDGGLRHMPRDALRSLLHPGDVVVANDAATLPASLHGVHLPTGRAIEIRLAGRATLDPSSVAHMLAVVFGDGDFHQRTEDRPAPPLLRAGDRLRLGPLRATIEDLLDHPRLVTLRFEGAPQTIWQGIARHGRPIQYAHLQAPLDLWDIWTPIADLPAAFEPPSAGFALSWRLLEQMAADDIRFATLTHAAGISSTGDPQLDARLPFDEPYRIPESTARLINDAHASGQRVVAVGTSVVRALEQAAIEHWPLRAGDGLATIRIDARTRLRAVHAILSGTHEPGTSHHELLCAFTSQVTLDRMDDELNRHTYRTHEFGDSIFLVRNLPQAASV